jgi:hypothetical protein
VPLTQDEQWHKSGDGVQPPRFYGSPRLFAIARDPWTIFAYWNADWPSIFKNTAPIDRQVHLRIHCAEDLEEKSVAVEPMAGMHYVTISRPHRSCRIEIGYYQPGDFWHSVAMSNEIVMPPAEISVAEDVDLATIPFHLSFQQLVDLFEANDDALATIISRFQTRVLSSDEKTLRGRDEKILRELRGSVSEVAAEWRAFDDIDDDKLASRTRALLGFGSSSPFRGFGESSWS